MLRAAMGVKSSRVKSHSQELCGTLVLGRPPNLGVSFRCLALCGFDSKFWEHDESILGAVPYELSVFRMIIANCLWIFS